MATISITEKKRRRRHIWQQWLTAWERSRPKRPTEKIKRIPNTARLLNDFYWRLIDQYIEPLIKPDKDSRDEHYVHYYKIISVSELTVMSVLPFYFAEEKSIDKIRELNAEFAFFVATTIMLTWEIKGKPLLNESDLTVVYYYNEPIDYIKGKGFIPYHYNFMDEHKAWLSQVNTATNLPVVSNSQTWRMCFMAAKAVSTVGNLK